MRVPPDTPEAARDPSTTSPTWRAVPIVVGTASLIPGVIAIVDAAIVRLILVVTALGLVTFLVRIPTSRPGPTSGTMDATRPHEEPR